MGIVIETGFRPPRWLRGGHRQSILVGLSWRRGAVERRAAGVRAAAREWLLDCGAGVRLQAWHSSPAAQGRPAGRRVAMLLHGWEGSAESLYLLSAAQALFDAGYEVVRLNLRDHGDTHHLNEALFHSCRLPEVVGAVRAVQHALPDRPVYLAGFSLGGNFALRVAACAEAEGLRVARTFAVSPVLDPGQTLLQLERGPQIYHRYFVMKWSRSLKKKQAAWPSSYRLEPVMRSGNLRQMTDELVREHTDIRDMATYLAGYAITGDRLATLTAPATILTAMDDPIIAPDDLRRLSFAGPLRVRLTATGGHCGYLTSIAGASWVDQALVEDFGRLTEIDLTVSTS
jgi:predicted alpha/beta-fold hydrolase